MLCLSVLYIPFGASTVSSFTAKNSLHPVRPHLPEMGVCSDSDTTDIHGAIGPYSEPLSRMA